MTAAVDAAHGPIADGLRVENERMTELFNPAAADRTLELLEHGLQTREGERDLEGILNQF